jgi:hypothetical protein
VIIGGKSGFAHVKKSDIVKINKTESVFPIPFLQILYLNDKWNTRLLFGKRIAMNKQLQKGYIALAIVSVLWGTTYIAARIGAQHMPGLFVAGLRQFSAGIIMVSFFLIKGYHIPGWDSMKRISIQGILLLCFAN